MFLAVVKYPVHNKIASPADDFSNKLKTENWIQMSMHQITYIFACSDIECKVMLLAEAGLEGSECLTV